MLRRGLSSRVLPGSGRAAEFVRVAALAAAGVALAVLLWQLVPRLGLFVEFNQTVLRYPWTIDYDEGVNIGSAYLLSQGQNPYGPNHDGFVSTPYPPIHTVLGALILRVGGISLLGGRLLSLVATLATALLAAWLVACEAGQRFAGLLGGLLAAALFLALGPTIVWASFYKQDMLALALGLAGLCWIARWPAGRRVYGALPWLVLAVYTKQTAVTAPLAAILYLLWRDWRTGLRFAVACGVAVALPVVALQV